MARKKFILALLPEESVAQKLEVLSQKLCGPHKGYVLGYNSLPHNSLLQFEEDETKAENLWEKFTTLPQPPQVTGLRFYTEAMSDGSAIYFGLALRLTEELISFQSKAWEMIENRELINKTGAGYFPHYTLGYVPMPGKMSIEISEVTHRLPLHSCHLALGIGGPNLQFETTLFSRSN
ncbi:MAG: hypothetical protein GC129_03490 [Proteobacteria bacterium]|nr:hypothetical protein [Pseudomonadota bacterium]